MIKSRHRFGMCALNGMMYAFGGRVTKGCGCSIECYDPIRNEWKMIDSMLQPRFDMGVVSFEGLIYIVGGSTKRIHSLSDLISYNPVTKEWNTYAHMWEYRTEMGVAVLDRYLYVVGGEYNCGEPSRNVERYSFDEDKWTKVAPMSVARRLPAVEVADGHIFAFGGYGLSLLSRFNSVECYDPLTDSWEGCPNLPCDYY